MKIVNTIYAIFLFTAILATYVIDSKVAYLSKVGYFNISVILIFFLNSKFKFLKKFDTAFNFPIFISIIFSGAILVQDLSHITNTEMPKMKNLLMVVYFLYTCFILFIASKKNFKTGFIFPITIFLFTSFPFQWAYSYSLSGYSALFAYSLYSLKFTLENERNNSSSNKVLARFLIFSMVGLLLFRAIVSNNLLLTMPASYRYASGILFMGVLIFSYSKLRIFKYFSVIILFEIVILFLSSLFTMSKEFTMKNFLNKKLSLFSINANDISFFFLIVLSFLMAYLIISFGKKSLKQIFLSATFISVIVYLLIFMISRTSLLVAALGFIFLIVNTSTLRKKFFQKKVLYKFLFVIPFIFLIIFLLSKSDEILNTDSFLARLGLWNLSIRKILQAPILGHGADNYLYLGVSDIHMYSFYGYTILRDQLRFSGSFLPTHNTPLAFLYENGALFFALLTIMHLLIFRKRKIKSIKTTTFIFYSGLTALIVSHVYGIMNYSFMILHIWIIYCGVLGFLIPSHGENIFSRPLKSISQNNSFIEMRKYWGKIFPILGQVLLIVLVGYFLIFSYFFSELLRNVEPQLKYNTLRNFRIEENNLPDDLALQKAFVWAGLLKNISLEKDPQVLELYAEINKALYIKTKKSEYQDNQFKALEKCRILNPEQLSCHKLLLQLYPDRISDAEKKSIEDYIKKFDLFHVMEIEKTFQIR